MNQKQMTALSIAGVVAVGVSIAVSALMDTPIPLAMCARQSFDGGNCYWVLPDDAGIRFGPETTLRAGIVRGECDIRPCPPEP